MKITLIEKKPEAKDTVTFQFKTDKVFRYLPGQFVYITLPELNYTDSRGPTRHFTISSSPTEGEKSLTITTRIRDASGFKQSLNELKPGQVLEADGPNGTFILDENELGSHVILAGGIGITPFRSMLKYSFDKSLNNHFHLIYSNSVPEEITFSKEIESWSEKHVNLKLDMLITRPEEAKSKWSGKTGRLDANYLGKLTSKDELEKAFFWICGPPAMVTAYEKMVKEINIPSSRIRSEKFTGY